MLMEILLFYYIISRLIENVIIDKSTFVKDLLDTNDDLKKVVRDYYNSTEYQRIKEKAVLDRELREIMNIQLTWDSMLAPFIVVISIIIMSVGYEIILVYKLKKPKTHIDPLGPVDQASIIIREPDILNDLDTEREVNLRIDKSEQKSEDMDICSEQGSNSGVDSVYPIKRMDRIDFFILLTVLVAFFSEVIFYLVVISRMIYVSDTDILLYLVNIID
jgi:hypothetical protein